MSMLQRYSNLKVSPLPNGTWILEEDYECDGYVIPKGFTTNGADIPRVFWSIYPPNNPKYMPAIVLHDFLIDQCKKNEFKDENKQISCFKKADQALYKCLGKIYASSFTQGAYYGGVRIYTSLVRRGYYTLKRLTTLWRIP